MHHRAAGPSLCVVHAVVAKVRLKFLSIHRDIHQGQYDGASLKAIVERLQTRNTGV